MLKKLVKYGNSNALVLDKALLELLNIEEGSVVKLRTDGTSLIITAQHMVSQGKLTRTVTPQDTLQEAISQNLMQNYENADVYLDELRKVCVRYADITKKLYSPEITQKIQEIEQRFNGNRTNPEFLKEVHLLRSQHVPELEQMDYEIQQISQKYGGHKQYNGKFTNDVIAFKKVHEKYRHVLEQVIQLNENPEYIHESVLLAEKYQATKNSPEYIQEHANLITRHIPEYAAYQNEIKAVGESLNKEA